MDGPEVRGGIDRYITEKSGLGVRKIQSFYYIEVKFDLTFHEQIFATFNV